MTFEEYHEDPKEHNQFETDQLAKIDGNPLILFAGLAHGEWANVDRLIYNYDSMTDSFSSQFVQTF